MHSSVSSVYFSHVKLMTYIIYNSDNWSPVPSLSLFHSEQLMPIADLWKKIVTWKAIPTQRAFPAFCALPGISSSQCSVSLHCIYSRKFRLTVDYLQTWCLPSSISGRLNVDAGCRVHLLDFICCVFTGSFYLLVLNICICLFETFATLWWTKTKHIRWPSLLW